MSLDRERINRPRWEQELGTAMIEMPSWAPMPEKYRLTWNENIRKHRAIMELLEKEKSHGLH